MFNLVADKSSVGQHWCDCKLDWVEHLWRGQMQGIESLLFDKKVEDALIKYRNI